MPGRVIGVSVDRAGPAGAAHGAADPRAAHPPREGDQQHLHRPGPARGHGRDVRGLPRPGRADAGSRARVHRLAAILAAGLRRARRRGRDPGVLRHAHRCASRAGAEASAAEARARRASTCAWSMPTTSASRSTRPPGAPRICEALWSVFARDAELPELEELDRERRRPSARAAAAPERLPRPIRCSSATTARPRCCATCAGCRTRTWRSTAA